MAERKFDIDAKNRQQSKADIMAQLYMFSTRGKNQHTVLCIWLVGRKKASTVTHLAKLAQQGANENAAFLTRPYCVLLGLKSGVNFPVLHVALKVAECSKIVREMQIGLCCRKV